MALHFLAKNPPIVFSLFKVGKAQTVPSRTVLPFNFKSLTDICCNCEVDSLKPSWFESPLPNFIAYLKFGCSEESKIWKNLPLNIWRCSVASNSNWKIFSNFVPFSECPNFMKKYMTAHRQCSQSKKWNLAQTKVTLWYQVWRFVKEEKRWKIGKLHGITM